MAALRPNGDTTAYWGVPWEVAYGYAQARQVGNEIYVSGQFNHDEDGNLVAPAPLDCEGKPSDFSAMGEQMRTTYDNISKLLALYGATLEDVVEETLFVLAWTQRSPLLATCARPHMAPNGLDAPATLLACRGWPSVRN